MSYHKNRVENIGHEYFVEKLCNSFVNFTKKSNFSTQFEKKSENELKKLRKKTHIESVSIVNR